MLSTNSSVEIQIVAPEQRKIQPHPWPNNRAGSHPPSWPAPAAAPAAAGGGGRHAQGTISAPRVCFQCDAHPHDTWRAMQGKQSAQRTGRVGSGPPGATGRPGLPATAVGRRGGAGRAGGDAEHHGPRLALATRRASASKRPARLEAKVGSRMSVITRPADRTSPHRRDCKSRPPGLHETRLEGWTAPHQLPCLLCGFQIPSPSRGQQKRGQSPH